MRCLIDSVWHHNFQAMCFKVLIRNSTAAVGLVRKIHGITMNKKEAREKLGTDSVADTMEMKVRKRLTISEYLRWRSVLVTVPAWTTGTGSASTQMGDSWSGGMNMLGS